MAASLAQLVQASPRTAQRVTAAPSQSPSYRMLNRPRDGEEVRLSALFHQSAQGLSDKLFGSLATLLGGTAPTLNFVPTGSPLAPDNLSTNLTDRPGAPKGTINADPLAVESLVNNASPYHDSGVNGYPHEFAHTRQLPQTLADLMRREGGAQAFADLVTPTAAQRAGIPYNPVVGNVDGAYAPFVQAVQQPPYGRDWIMGAQFGRTAPPAWP